MAKYEIDRICGHWEIIQLYGQYDDRRYKLEKVEPKKLCEECYQKQIDEQRAAEAVKAVEMAQQHGFPALTGSAKQIAWAETIRYKMMVEIEKIINSTLGAADLATLAAYGFTPDDLQQGVRLISTQMAASWWIEHRHLTGKTLINLLSDTIKSIALIRRSNAKISAN